MKKMLTKAMQADIARQMYNVARDIDVAIYNYLDNTMDHDFILDALMFYLTKDGGFGGGLYIDNYNTNASVYQVYEALRIMDMCDFDKSCKLELYDLIINKAFNFIYNRAELKDNRFNPNVKTNDDFAHSMEFSYTEDNRLLFGYHPTAAILGYTLKFCNEKKAYYKKAIKMIDVMLNDFYKMEKLTKYEFISFNIFLKIIKELNLYQEDAIKIEEKLIKLAKENVSLDFDDYSKIHPLDCAMALNDNELNNMIDLQLDSIIDKIQPHGLWDYEGNWGYNKYAEEDSAKIKWVGAVSVNNYFYLKKYGRIE